VARVYLCESASSVGKGWCGQRTQVTVPLSRIDRKRFVIVEGSTISRLTDGAFYTVDVLPLEAGTEILFSQGKVKHLQSIRERFLASGRREYLYNIRDLKKSESAARRPKTKRPRSTED
jgi:hypothetical protein